MDTPPSKPSELPLAGRTSPFPIPQHQSEFKSFETKLNLKKIKLKQITKVDSYVNGLPDLFEPYKQVL